LFSGQPIAMAIGAGMLGLDWLVRRLRRGRVGAAPMPTGAPAPTPGRIAIVPPAIPTTPGWDLTDLVSRLEEGVYRGAKEGIKEGIAEASLTGPKSNLFFNLNVNTLSRTATVTPTF